MFYIFKFGYVYILTVNRGKGEIIAPSLLDIPPPWSWFPKGSPSSFPHTLSSLMSYWFVSIAVSLSQQSIYPNSLSVPTVYLSQQSIYPNRLSVPKVCLSQ